MKNLQRFATIAASACLFAACASADIIQVESATYGPSTTDFTYSLVIPQYAGPGAGYHLVSVTLDVSAASNESTFSLNNTSATNQQFGLFFGTDIAINSNSASSDAVGDTIIVPVFSSGGSALSPSKTIQLGATGGPACPNSTPSYGCSSVSYAPLSASGDDGTITISSANWANYVGSGNVTIGGNTSSTTVFNGGGGNIGLNQVTTASVTGTITYDYALNSTTPEPASMVLFGSALIGLGLLRKRIRS